MTARLIVVLALLGAAGAARAQVLRLSPGPLAAPHAGLEGVTGCFKCHSGGGSKRDVTCTSCHQHRALKQAMDAGRGLHARLKRPCLDCHTEHKGRDRELADWSSLGGRDGFRHDLTGYSLKGIHDRTACVSCHKRRTAGGRTAWTGLPTRCDGCHAKPHPQTRAALRQDCAACHVPGGTPTRQLRAGAIPFDHAATGTPLTGRHLTPLCSKCHERGRMVAGLKRTCTDCHRNRHGVNFTKVACASCHPVTGTFKQVTFDHRTTRFQLAGKHRVAPCLKCHKDPERKAAVECHSCHRDLHQGRFAPAPCESCHPSGVRAPSLFNHNRRTKFQLTAKHAQVRCRACHPGSRPAEFLRRSDVIFRDLEGGVEILCRKCHTKTHGDQFGEKKCLACHVEPGSRKLKFDHQRDSRFALTGIHLTTRCGKCHARGEYRNNKLECRSCHNDPHAGKLGTECGRCHPTTVRFKTTSQFDHSRTSYPLEGLHRAVACLKCHPDKRYKLGRPSCADCHRATDPHQGRLGERCERCHRIEKAASKFVHETMTRFPREGHHLIVRCEFCHRPRPLTGPPPKDWTRGLKPAKLDPRFPVMGKRCADCHADPHHGRYGTECQSCHRGGLFSDARAVGHDTGAFRLDGIHATLSCARCHTANRALAGLGTLCQGCHWRDDAHRNALGPRCGDCHEQQKWHPARFSHVQTGFPLRGAHRTTPCGRCHGIGTYGGLPTLCETCHATTAATVKDPLHSAELRPCDRCHSEISFVPARFTHNTWPLIGQHRFVRCRNCHGGGMYSGTPTTCESCHMSLYLSPRTKPNHRAAGYATTCEDCHSPVGWNAARRRR